MDCVNCPNELGAEFCILHNPIAVHGIDLSVFHWSKQLVLSDLNTAEAIGLLSGLVSRAEDEGIDSEKIQTLLDQLDQVFGLSLANREDIDAEIKQLINQRETARQQKDWQKSDEIRQQLFDKQIEVNDTASGPMWRRL